MMRFSNLKNVFFMTSSMKKQWLQRLASESHELPEKTVILPTISKRQTLPHKMTYLDTAADNNNLSMATILLLHGTPGSFKDFNLQIPFFKNKGVRVLSVNFPDYRYIHESKGQYCHTPEDRAEYVKSLLTHLSIEKIDLLVGHSSALYPSLLLAKANSKPKVKSLALLNPATHIVSKVIKPLILSKFLVFMGKRENTINALDYLTKLLRISLSPVKTAGIDHPIYALTTIMTADLKKIQNSLELLRDTKFPTLLAYSGNDKLFEIGVYKDMEKLLVPDQQLLVGVSDKYNENGQIIEESTQRNEWIRILHFEKGTHYSMWKHPQIINENLLQLLQKVTKT